jgi:VCBS repeat-containing protein
VTDGMDQSPLTTVTIQVGGTNTRPVANNDAYFAIVDTPLAVNAANGLIKNDTDAEGDLLVASLYRGPRFGTLTLAPDGSFQYQPNSGFIGIDSFLYRVSDGEVTSRLAAVTLHVRPGTTSAIQAAALKSLAASRMDVALSGIADQAFLIPDTTMDSLATDIRRRNLGRKVL